MASSTKRSKPRNGQTTGKTALVKKDSTQPANNSTTQPITKTAPVSKPTEKAGNGTSPEATRPASATVISKTTQAGPKTSVVKAPPAALSQSSKHQQKRDEINRRLEERRQQREREQRNRLLRRWAVYGGGALLALGVIAFLVVRIFFGPATPPYLTGATIDGIPCDQLEHTQVHYHAELQMYVNGQPQAFPSNAGRQASTPLGGCFYWLHTHYSDGVIHIEVLQDGTYRLGQFFDIWGQQLSSTNLLGNKTDTAHKLTIYVFNPTQAQLTQKAQDAQAAQAQGQDPPPFTVTPPAGLQPYTGDPRNIQLEPNEVIYLEYGTTVAPQAYTFASGL